MNPAVTQLQARLLLLLVLLLLVLLHLLLLLHAQPMAPRVLASCEHVLQAS